MKEITHVSFVADFETGAIQGVGAANVPNSDFNIDFNSDFIPPVLLQTMKGDPQLCMRYSNDGGNSWSNYRQKGLLTSGNYRQMMRWRGLGMARDRVYELMWSFNGPSALQGAYLEPLQHGS